MNILSLNNLEDRIYRYFWIRRKGVARFTFFTFLLLLLNLIPYINLIFSKSDMVLVIVSLFFVFVVKNAKAELIFIFSLLFIAMILLVFNFTERSELLASWSYVILFVTLLEMILK